MLESTERKKITTAQLAHRLGCSEAALYRHFASKAQMFDALLDFVESSLFNLINRITTEERNGMEQIREMTYLLLGFAEKNRGMTRVLIGEAVVYEKPQLQARINKLHGKLEAALKQSLRIAVGQKQMSQDANLTALSGLVSCFVLGKWALYVKSDFTRTPLAEYESQWRALAAALQTPTLFDVASNITTDATKTAVGETIFARSPDV